MGVVGSDLWRFASFSPSSSEGPFSVSMWSASLGAGKATVSCNTGGLLYLLLLPEVGCSVSGSVVTSYVEEQSTSPSARCLMCLSSCPLADQFVLRRTTRSVKVPFLSFRHGPITPPSLLLIYKSNCLGSEMPPTIPTKQSGQRKIVEQRFLLFFFLLLHATAVQATAECWMLSLSSSRLLP